MLRLVNKFLFVLFIVFLTGFTYFGQNIQFGGEIPWPLSNQRAVSESTSKGLWDLSNYENRKMFNVEIVTKQDVGYDWIRVAELDPETFEVISWGEGVFRNSNFKTSKFESSFFDVTTQPGTDEDVYGRYLTMFPNGDFSQQPYILRLVEVKTALGHVLGLSIIHYAEQTYDHMLGRRVLVNPLECETSEEQEEKLNCFFE